MRNGLVLGGLTLVIAAAALAVGIVALVLPASDSDELADGIDFQLSDRAEFTVDMVVQALNRYKAEGREATINYYNSLESVVGEWYVFILDENDEVIAHRNPDLLGEDAKGDIGVDSAGYRFGDVLLSVDERARPVGGLSVRESRHRKPGVQTFLGGQA